MRARNGKTSGITYPSAAGQAAVIRAAYAKAGISNFGETSYCELHGTGTPAGDPVEVAAVGSVFGSSREPGEPMLIGSVKTNLGHSESSSGIASVLKAVFALETGMIPPTIGVTRLNPASGYAYQISLRVLNGYS